MNPRISTVALIAVAMSAGTHFTLREGQAAAPRRPLSALVPFRTPRTVWDSVYSAEQAKRGEEVFGKSCERCHKAALTGADDAPPLAGSASGVGYYDSEWRSFRRAASFLPCNRSPGFLYNCTLND